MNAALYHRVSTVEQNATTARHELRAAAKRLGARIELDIEETGSGALTRRPGLQRVLEAVRRRRVDVVLCWKLDRLGRSPLDVLTNVELFKKYGVRFVVVDQGLDVDPRRESSVTDLIILVLAGMAGFERSLISDRTRAGLERAKREGKKLGRPPKKRRPDAREVRALRAEGHTRAQVARALRTTIHLVRQAEEES